MGHKMDKLKGVNFYSSRTVQSFLYEIGRWMPDIYFNQIDAVKGKRIFLKFDEMSLNFSGKIYSAHGGIEGFVTPYITDELHTPAKNALQFLLTDVDSGESYIGPFFFINTLTSIELEHLLSRVLLAFMQICEVLVTFN